MQIKPIDLMSELNIAHGSSGGTLEQSTEIPQTLGTEPNHFLY